MQQKSGRHRGCCDLRAAGLPTLQRTMENHIGLRSTFHRKLCAGSVRTIEHQAKHKHGLSPADRWAVGASQRTIGAILVHLRECGTGQLGCTTANGAIHA
jgi:hypothetical protein